MRLAELTTPTLLLDHAKLERNVERMHRGLRKLGAPLRPHVKTAKCVEAARAMVDGQAGGITVSTLAEAEFFLRHGFTDILYAVGIAPQRLPIVASLTARGAQMTIILDSIDAARAVAEYPWAEDTSPRVLIEIDSGDHRGGLACDNPLILEIANIVESGGSAAVHGVLTHAGHSYACESIECIFQTAEHERAAAVAAAGVLRSAGYEVTIVSVGSTPTATFARSMEGVTEVRAGVFVTQDLVMAGLGVCSVNDVALSVLTTVIGQRPDESRVLVDCGWMAISRDRGTALQKLDQYFGLVCDENGDPLGDLVVTATSQEHGIVSRRDGGAFDVASFPIGRRLRILPNHACATAGANPSFTVVDGNDVVDVWERCTGWS